MSRSNYGIFACCFIFAIAILYINKYSLISDDLWFSERSFSEPDHIKWVISRYFSWSSRTPIEYALISLINKFNIWAIINSCMFSLLIIGIYSINGSLKDDAWKIAPALATSLLIFSIPKDIFFNGTIWITGSFNYLWPSALAFYGYSLLIGKIVHKDNGKWRALLCYASIFLSSFNEQLAIVNLLIMLLLIIYSKIHGKKTSSIMIAVGIILLVLVYIATCPGNKARYYSEIATWYKGYGSFNVLQKAMLGLNLYADMLIAEKSIVPSVMAFSMALICDKKTRAFPIAAGLIMLFLYVIPSSPEALSKVKLSEDIIFSALSIYRVLFALVVTILILVPVILSQKTSLSSFLILAMIAGAIASASMLGFSPTVYASGNRILYIPYLLFITASIAAITIFINDERGKPFTFRALDK